LRVTVDQHIQHCHAGRLPRPRTPDQPGPLRQRRVSPCPRHGRRRR
jgi:hypothetical protein